MGWPNVAHGIPLTPGTPVNVASTRSNSQRSHVLPAGERTASCASTTTCGGMVPEVPDFGHPLTIRMLLNHHVRLRELANLFYAGRVAQLDVEYKSDVLAMDPRQRALNHLPGAEFATTAAGYTFLAIGVERPSRAYPPPFRHRPDIHATRDGALGRAGGCRPGDSAPRHCYWGHDPAKRCAPRGHPLGSPAQRRRNLRRGSRAVDANFYEVPSRHSGAAETRWSTPGRLADGTEFGYGLGLSLDSHRGRKMISHAGSDYGYKADFVRFPAEQLTVAVLCNAFDIAPTPLALQVADLYLPRTE